MMSVLSALRLSIAPAAAFVVLGAFWGIFAAYVPVIKAGLGADDRLFGLLLLGTSIGLVMAMWLAPRLDRWLGPHGMQVASAGFALVWLFPAQLSLPFAFGIAMAIVGIFSGLLDVVMNARVSELEARHRRTLMNANHAMFSVAYAVAAVLTGLAREAGLAPVWVFGGFCLATFAILPLMKMEVEIPEPHDRETHGYPVVPILLCGGIVLVAFMAEASVEAWSALHVERTLGGGAAEGALGPAMLGLTMAIGRFSGQAVAERLSEIKVVVWGTILAAAGALVAAAAPTPLFGIVGFGILGLGVSVVGPLGLALAGRIVPPALRTEAISRAAVMGFSGFFFAPVIMGLISDGFGLRVAFGCVAILVLGALPLVAAVARRPVQGG